MQILSSLEKARAGAAGGGALRSCTVSNVDLVKISLLAEIRKRGVFPDRGATFL